MAVTAPFKVKCESCELIFVINDLSFVGKQISCRHASISSKFRSPTKRVPLLRRRLPGSIHPKHPAMENRVQRLLSPSK